MIRSMLAAAALLAALPISAEALELQSDTLHLGWGADHPAPTTFQVRSDRDARWQSLISADSKLGGSRHLQLHIGGEPLDNWQLDAADPTGVVARSHDPDRELEFRQHFELAEGGHTLHLQITVTNQGGSETNLDGLGLSLGPGLGEEPIDGLGMAAALYSFVDTIGLVDGRIQRPARPEPGETLSLGELAGAEWLGLYSRYFALLLKPDDPTTINSASAALPAPDSSSLPARYLPGLMLELDEASLAAGESREWEFTVFAGPRSRQAVAAGEADFSDVLFPGLWQWMRYLCFGLLWLLEVLFALIPSWGLAIIVLAVLVRLAMYPLARRALAGQHAFAEVQRRIQPEIAEIKQRYKGGEQSERILELYEKHDVSPLAGLKPLLIVLIQIPVFIALFHVLGQAFELREAPFLWIETLAEPDRLFSMGLSLPFFGQYFNLLPVLLAITTLMTLKLSPAPAADATAQRRQNIFLVIMALGFFLIFYPFPAGMVLYWTAANILHIAQSRLTSSSR
ncbi:YidC/Oxa1 family insertase periplasmic-domain containing protein [Wenzhouxiangella sp. AB-CW3]|uniref:YidC/Oxa1 family insertase periplasmic-domain containing protein n=1 Tax=Wenzhouxiangella sp. AB-CW3 TaxID=2771012 RepID=UPI00168BE904|nr:YidC/Oxa1 family insertase periplasmic-domain containing protein [Wenzhouxiangella sp. AB-CW3]QOC23741.1 YidC/Oxa1 family insertase periplasmic-domain containing protein [Wenzhouxiangella sp. AB-CW3]